MGRSDMRFSEQRTNAIVEAVRSGLTKTRAFRLCALDETIGFDWMRRGEEGEEPYASFRQRVEQAEVEFEAELLEKVKTAAMSEKPNTWQAAMTILERRFPQLYGRNDRVTVEGDPDRPVQVVTHHLLQNPESLAAVLGELGQLAKSPPKADLELEAVEEEYDKLTGS